MQTSLAQNGNNPQPPQSQHQDNITFSINQILSPTSDNLDTRCNGTIENDDNAAHDVTNATSSSVDYYETEQCKTGNFPITENGFYRQTEPAYYPGSFDGYYNGSCYNGQYYPGSRFSDSFYTNSYPRHAGFGHKPSHLSNRFSYGQDGGGYVTNSVNKNYQTAAQFSADLNNTYPTDAASYAATIDTEQRSSCKFMKTNQTTGSTGNSVTSGSSSGGLNGGGVSDSASPLSTNSTPTSRHFYSGQKNDENNNSQTRELHDKTKTNLRSVVSGMIPAKQRNTVDMNASVDETRFNSAFSASNYYNTYCSGYAAAAAAASFLNGGIPPSSCGVGSLSMSALSPVVTQPSHHFNHHQAAAMAAVGSAVAAASAANAGVIRVPAQR